MGWLGKDPWATNTIPSWEMAGLSRRAQKAQKGSMFDKHNVDKRKASEANRKNAKKN